MKVLLVKWNNDMKRSITSGLGFILITLCLFSSCKEDGMLYEGNNYIKFVNDSTNYSFYGSKTVSLEGTDTIAIELALLGQLSSYDREVAIVAADSSTAVEGVNYTIIKPLVLSADSITSHAKIVLYRTDDLKDVPKVLWLDLQDSKDLLRANYKDRKSSIYKVSISNDLKKPSWWDGYFYNYVYSNKRMQFYMDVIGTDVAPASLPGGFQLVMYRLRVALLEYNANHPGEPYTDDNGVPINWDL